MLLGDLIRTPVVDAEGKRLGHVEDVLLVQDGAYVDGFGHGLRVHGLVAGSGLAVRLGIARSRVQGPWLVVVVLQWLERKSCYVEWADVESIDEHLVRVRAGGHLRPVPSR